MRITGRISDWQDEKGFGFVVPSGGSGGGERAFVHISEFQRGSRRPVVGDLVSYRPGKDSRGRPQARAIRHASRTIETRRRSRFSRAAIGIGALTTVAGIAAIGAIPMPVAGFYFALSGVSYFMYVADKAAAGENARRIPERNLHLADLLGGWPGALIAQQRLRHKTLKQPFQSVFRVTVVLNLVGTWWLVSSGTVSRLSGSITG